METGNSIDCTLGSNSQGVIYQALETPSIQSSEYSYFHSAPSSAFLQTIHEQPTDLSDFLQQVDPENWVFIHGIFAHYGFTVNDIYLMTCCQLTAITLPNDMVYITRFWNKLVQFKKSNASISSTNAIVETSNIDLLRILQWAVENDMKGSKVLKGLYSSNNKKGLTGNDRVDLAHIILSYLKEHEVPSDDQILTQLAEEIMQYFKGEDKDAYFSVKKINNRTVKSGKLFNKKYNIRRPQKSNKPSKQPIENDHIYTIMSIFSSLDSEYSAKEDVLWLQENLYCENFDEIVKRWKATAIHRQKCFEEEKNSPTAVNLFKQWPHYQLPNGHQLVFIDYDIKFQDTKENFYDRYKIVFVPLMMDEIFETELKDVCLRKIWKEFCVLEESMTEDAKNALVMYLLHGVLKPTKKTVEPKKKANNEAVASTSNVKRTRRATANAINNSNDDKTTKQNQVSTKGSPVLYGIQDSIYSMIKTRTNVSATLPPKKIEQPYILCIGDDIYHLKEFYVVMEETKYCATSFLHAIEIAMKISNLFGFRYPLESTNVWLFIQKFFFDVHYKKWDQMNNDILNLIQKLVCYEKDLDLETESLHFSLKP